MKICGLNKTTLLDYPGKVAATIFLGNCNFRCPFCHNRSLVLHPEKEPSLSQEAVLEFLKKRRKILDGVCITGGEPTMSRKLPEFLFSIKELGYLVKLDTNGSHPEVVQNLAKSQLIDMVAMDIKSSPEHYSRLTGIASPNLDSIQKTVDFLMEGTLEYEFRTTAVKELHSEQDFLSIGKWLQGARAYYLQAYKDSENVLQPGFHSFSQKELNHFRDILRAFFPVVEIRGVD